MKVIDLYLAIERNKNIPKKVVYKYKTYRYYPEYKQYYREEYGDMISLFSEANCDDKVYLIEDTPKKQWKVKNGRFVVDKVLEDGSVIIAEEDKKIEKLDMSDTHYMIDHTEIMEKINEIIDRLNGVDNDSK